MGKFFINRPIFAIVISIVIVIIGLVSIRSLPVEQYPDITPPVVEVSTDYVGADAIIVDQSVATPIAQSVMGVENMLYMQTTSANDGSMSLQILFDIGTDPDLNTLFTQNNVNSSMATLPTSVKTKGITTQQAMPGFLMIYTISSDGRYDDIYLTNYTYINIQNELLKIDGVGKVQIMGSGEYSMRIWVKPDLMNYYNISVEDIETAVTEQSSIFSAGKLGARPTYTPSYFTYTVTTAAQINNPDEFGEIVLKTLSDGKQLRLKDVARVELGSEMYDVVSSSGGDPAAIIIIFQTPGSNAVDVGSKVETTLSGLETKFPDGINISKIADSTSSINDGIKEIILTLLFALLLVIIIIFLFIQDVRATIIPLIAIPISLIGAFALFPLFGFSVNIISLLGLVLAIGLVVDDAIVIVEAVQIYIEQGNSPKKATIEAMKNVSSPIIATTVILLAIFIPISLSGGITGKLFQQFTITIAIAVTISAFNALTLTPALCAMLLREREPKTKGFFGSFNRWFGRRMEGYNNFNRTLSRHLSRSFLFIAVIAAALFLIAKQLPTGFLPDEDQGYLMVSATLPPASSVARTVEVTQQIEEIIKRHPEVVRIANGAGFNMLSNIFSTNSAAMFVQLSDYSDRKMSAMELADILNEELYMEVSDAIAFSFNPPSIPGLGVASGVTFVVQQKGSDNIRELESYTTIFLDSLRKNSAVGSVTTQFSADVPQRNLVINQNYAEREGVDIGELHSLISAYLGGEYVDNFNRFGRVYDTYIQADAMYRTDASDLNNFFIENGDGEDVPLSAFVSVVDTVGVEYISQFNLFRSIAVNLSPAKGYTSAQCMELIDQYADEILPDNYAIAWSGISYQEKTASSDLGMIFALALIFAFLTLAALYDSWILPLSIIMGIPFSLFGAMLFVWVAHFLNPLYINNLFMQISLIMLIALSAKNAILIIEYANILFFEQNKSLKEAALEAARLRIRPIIMTAFAFIIGVMPLVFASGVYSVARNIIGVSLIGGMLIATILGLFIYPMLYVIFGKLASFEKKRELKKESI